MIFLAIVVFGFNLTLEGQSLENIPERYQNKRMPEGWWTDPKIIFEGKRVYEGKAKRRVVCSSCHGRRGKPVLPKARDLRNASYFDHITESYWFWRIAEGIPNTPMKPWKEHFTESEIWKVIAYSHSFSHNGKSEKHRH